MGRRRHTLTAWKRAGTEEMVGDTLLTRVGRRPPEWTMEHVANTGHLSKGLLTKLPPNPNGARTTHPRWGVQVNKELGFTANTKRQAIAAFASMAEEAGRIQDERDEAS